MLTNSDKYKLIREFQEKADRGLPMVLAWVKTLTVEEQNFLGSLVRDTYNHAPVSPDVSTVSKG